MAVDYIAAGDNNDSGRGEARRIDGVCAPACLNRRRKGVARCGIRPPSAAQPFRLWVFRNGISKAMPRALPSVPLADCWDRLH